MSQIHLAVENNRAVQKGKVVTMCRPVARQRCSQQVREGTTGRAVPMPPRLVVVPRPVKLERVWAVAEEASAVALPSHDEETVMDGAAEPIPEAAPERKVELASYRKYTEALLRRYMRLSMAAGRVPSLLGREMFRGHVTHYRAHTFEDAVIFCFDMERQLAQLTTQEKELVKRIALQQYTQMEVAGMLGVTLRHCVRLYGATLDRLTELFLRARLLEAQTLSRG
jgi:hypothetical protein